MIIVHHLNNSRSQRVLWLLEELGLEYEVKCYERDPKTMLAPASLRQIHPLGKSPIITDGELVLAESGAIVEYLVDRYGKGRLAPPIGTSEQLRYTYWLHYAEGSAMPPLLLKLVFDRLEQSPMPFFIRPIARSISGSVKSSFIAPQIAQHLAYLAAIAHLSPHYFTRLLKQPTRLTPHQFVIRCRVERAKTLLLAGKDAIAEIAQQVGFANQARLNVHIK